MFLAIPIKSAISYLLIYHRVMSLNMKRAKINLELRTYQGVKFVLLCAFDAQGGRHSGC